MGWMIDLLKDVPLSAVIKEKLVGAEKTITSLETQLALCQQEKSVLQSDLDQAKEQIRNLNLFIEGFNKQDQKKYDAETEKILRHFFDAGGELPLNYFLSIVPNTSTIQYHFDLLIKDNFIWRSTAGQQSSWARVDEPALYSLTPQGREYVVKNMDI
jgi:hypothetical protein